MSLNLQTQMQNYNLTWPTDFQFQNGRLYHFKKSVSENYPAHTYCHDRMAQLWDVSTWDNLQWIFEKAIPTLENNLNGTIWIDHQLATLGGIQVILNPDRTPFVTENKHSQRIDTVGEHNLSNCFSVKQESEVQYQYHSVNCNKELYVVCTRNPWKKYSKNYTIGISLTIERTIQTLSTYISRMENLEAEILKFQAKLPFKSENTKIKDLESPRKIYNSREQQILTPFSRVINRLIIGLEDNIEESTINSLMSSYQQLWDDFEEYIRDKLQNPQNIHKISKDDLAEFHKVYNNDSQAKELNLLVLFGSKNDLEPDFFPFDRQRFYEITFVDLTLAIGSGLAFFVAVAKIIHDCRKKEEHRTVLCDEEGSRLDIYRTDTSLRNQPSKSSLEGVKYSAILAKGNNPYVGNPPFVSEGTPMVTLERDKPYAQREEYSMSSFGSRSSSSIGIPINSHSTVILQQPHTGILKRTESLKSVTFDPVLSSF